MWWIKRKVRSFFKIIFGLIVLPLKLFKKNDQNIKELMARQAALDAAIKNESKMREHINNERAKLNAEMASAGLNRHETQEVRNVQRDSESRRITTWLKCMQLNIEQRFIKSRFATLAIFAVCIAATLLIERKILRDYLESNIHLPWIIPLFAAMFWADEKKDRWVFLKTLAISGAFYVGALFLCDEFYCKIATMSASTYNVFDLMVGIVGTIVAFSLVSGRE